MVRRLVLSMCGAMLCITTAGCQLSSQAIAEVPLDLVAGLHAGNDDAIAGQLARQQLDRSMPNYGGIRAANGLYHPGAASAFIRNLTAAYVSPQSRFTGSAKLLEAMNDAATFMLEVQHKDGTIDLLTTNFHSTPDTGFILEWMCSAAGVLRAADDPTVAPLLDRLLTFIKRGADALAVGGIHTPNHRWVVCMALARANGLIPDSRYVERVNTWLAENIDIDPDGQFTEQSTSIYSPLTNRCLITVARLLERPELLDAVRRNLEMSLFYMHADGQVATEGSRRQDQFRRRSMLSCYYPYRYMAQHDNDGRFASVVRQLEAQQFGRLSGQLIYFLESPELARPLPASRALPSDFAKHFTHSKLVRIRRGDISATILEDNASFFSLHMGSAAVVMRFASAFFGKAQFVGSQLHKEGSDWVMRQELSGPYYQPIVKSLRRVDGDWHKTGPSLRPTSEVQQLTTIVRIREQPGGFDVQIDITGTDGVPIAIEFACHPDTELSGAKPVEGGSVGWLATGEQARMSIGNDNIHLANLQARHQWTQIRGGLPKLAGKSLYSTGFTPFHRTVEFRN